MTRQRRCLIVGLASLVVTGVIGPAWGFDAAQTFAPGAYVLSVEAGGGSQFNLEGERDQTGLEFWNTGIRFGLLPWGVVGSGIFRGAFEVGLEPFYQRYTDPVRAYFAGLAAVGRYHFLALGRVVPYAELFAGAGGTDLRVREIDSDFTFLLQGGAGLSVFLTDHVAVYGGYRFQHVSNGNTDTPNRGFESHTGVAGVSYYFK
jgi:opacity protein-like surface antigen